MCQLLGVIGGFTLSAFKIRHARCILLALRFGRRHSGLGKGIGVFVFRHSTLIQPSRLTKRGALCVRLTSNVLVTLRERELMADAR